MEDFEAPFPAWEAGWLGTTSNLENYYVATGSPNTSRGNNPDGLWLSDADGAVNIDPLVDIVFDPTFASTLTAFSVDIAGYVPSTFRIYDAAGNTLLNTALTLTMGATTDPGTYASYSVTSSTGIGGFSFTQQTNQIEGNTSIDNVSVTVNGRSAPEPASMFLLGTALLAAGARRWRQQRA